MKLRILETPDPETGATVQFTEPLSDEENALYLAAIRAETQEEAATCMNNCIERCIRVRELPEERAIRNEWVMLITYTYINHPKDFVRVAKLYPVPVQENEAPAPTPTI